RPAQLARRMARVPLRQVHAAELIELYVRDAAREVVGDVPQEPGQKRRAHRALFGGERVGEANRSLRGDRRQVFLRQEAVVERLVETVRRERGAGVRSDAALGRNRRGLADARGMRLHRDGVVAAQARDLLGAVELPRQIALPGGYTPTAVADRNERERAQPA